VSDDEPGEELTRIARLEAELADLCQGRPYRVSWFLEDLRTGLRAERRAAEVVPAASTRKVAIMLAALAAVRCGELDLAQPLTIDERYRDRVFTGTLQHLAPGLVLPLRDAIALMIVLSDNLCTAHVVDLVGLDAVNALCSRAGLVSTVHRHALIPPLPRDHEPGETNATTAADQALLLRTILAGTSDAAAADRLGCTPELCALALEILRAQQHRDLLPALLPLGTEVACKTGLGWRDVADGGIVFRDDEPLYLLVAYADGIPETLYGGHTGVADARALIATMSRSCWDAL
jgi:beta-lactamase class A